MNKLATLVRTYRETEVINGSHISFFITFWLTKLFSLLQRMSTVIDSLIHKLVTILPTQNFTIKNKTGIFVVQPYDDSTTICSDYFEADIRDWLSTPPMKNIFIDIGANRGLYSVVAPTKYSYSNVHSFEPNKEVFNVLQQNIRLNKLEHIVVIHNTAIGSESKTAFLEVDTLHKGGGKVTLEGSNNQQITINPLENLIPISDFEKISFIKIDTEGYEFDVVAGMQKVLQIMPTGSCLMIETSDITKLTSTLSPYHFHLLKQKHNDFLFQKK